MSQDNGKHYRKTENTKHWCDAIYTLRHLLGIVWKYYRKDMGTLWVPKQIKAGPLVSECYLFVVM